MRNLICGTEKPRSCMPASKYLETSITPLLAADSLNSEWASISSPRDNLSKGRIFFSKYPSSMKVTIDTKLMRDGTPLPWMSKVTDGQVDMALCMTLCLVANDTELLIRVWNISSNWLFGVNGTVGVVLPWCVPSNHGQ